MIILKKVTNTKMGNHVFILMMSLMIPVFILSDTQAAEFQLHKMAPNEFEIVTSKVSKVIGPDDNKLEVLPFDLNQTFQVSRNQEKIGYLIPVKFNSKTYKNTICRLYFLDRFENLENVNLFAEKNDDEDIVTSCVGVGAVSINTYKSGSFDYLAVLRTRLANTYGSSGVVVRFEGNNFIYNQKLNSCLRKGKPIETITMLKKKNIICSKKY